MVSSAYIHIPFCKNKCYYCSFISTSNQKLKSNYVESLCREIEYYYDGNLLKTLYFGGGTPSLLNLSEAESILRKFQFDNTCEVTFEMNPEGMTLEYLEGLKRLGVNRLSIGSQTFNPEILTMIGRKHTPQDVFNTIKMARKAGFKNISIDLIYGLPTQTLEKFKFDLQMILELDVEHISFYGLKIENGCKFSYNMPKDLPDNDLQAEMYELAISTLKSEFHHYEVSNFAKMGFESKHNLTYWRNENYYGFGLAAHGYVNGVRYSNEVLLKNYLKNPCCHVEEHKVSFQEMLEEEIFLGFRKSDGIDVNLINQKFGINFDKKYSSVLSKYVEAGHIIKTECGYTLSDKGFLVSNIILADFLFD